MKLPDILWIPLTSFGALMRRHFKNDLRTVRSFERRWRRAMKDEEISSRAVSGRRFGDSFPHKLSGNDWHSGQIDWTHGTLGYGHRGGPDRSLFRCVELHRPTLMEWLEKCFPTAFAEPGAPSGVDSFHTGAHGEPTSVNLIESQTIRRAGKGEPPSEQTPPSPEPEPNQDTVRPRRQRKKDPGVEADLVNRIRSVLATATRKWSGEANRPPADQMAEELVTGQRGRKFHGFTKETVRQILLGTYPPMISRGIAGLSG